LDPAADHPQLDFVFWSLVQFPKNRRPYISLVPIYNLQLFAPEMFMKPTVLFVNGTERRVDAPPNETLLSVLRNHLELTGTKYGCGEGQCGACTVLIEGTSVRSCLTPLSSAANKNITTIEGLEHDGKLNAVQEAFLAEEAFQCGYCTSGMIMSSVALLAVNPNPTQPVIKRAMNGNLCRCGTYPRIIAAVQRAARSRLR
jgi:aerobic-type carbon monoxide dehydrogenase small subunit (CoxS/CutS family)